MGGNISSHFQFCRRLQEFLSALIILLKFMQIRALNSKFCRSSSSNTVMYLYQCSTRKGRSMPWYTCLYTVQCTASCKQYMLYCSEGVQESIQRNRFGEHMQPEPEFLNLLGSPGMDSQHGGIDFLESIPGSLKVYKFGLM